MKYEELLFISFVRETGVIPAVLLVTISSLQFPHTAGLLEIGLIVILATLIFEPPLTPWVAKKLKIADLVSDLHPDDPIIKTPEPIVVLTTRGGSFSHRLPFVATWAATHHVFKVLVLHCPEDKYFEAELSRVQTEVARVMNAFNHNRSANGQRQVVYSCESRPGPLQDALESLADDTINITTVFVGKKVLDYHLSDIKRLDLPVFFIA